MYADILQFLDDWIDIEIDKRRYAKSDHPPRSRGLREPRRVYSRAMADRRHYPVETGLDSLLSRSKEVHWLKVGEPEESCSRTLY